MIKIETSAGEKFAIPENRILRIEQRSKKAKWYPGCFIVLTVDGDEIITPYEPTQSVSLPTDPGRYQYWEDEVPIAGYETPILGFSFDVGVISNEVTEMHLLMGPEACTLCSTSWIVDLVDQRHRKLAGDDIWLDGLPATVKEEEL